MLRFLLSSTLGTGIMSCGETAEKLKEGLFTGVTGTEWDKGVLPSTGGETAEVEVDGTGSKFTVS